MISQSSHNRQHISRNQILKYLLLIGIATLILSIVGLQTRPGRQLATHGLLNLAPSSKHQFSTISNISASYLTPTSRIGKFTASFDEPDPNYEAAIASHALHSELHGYSHSNLREYMICGL